MDDAALAAVVHDDRALYEPAALRLADDEAERRGGVARASEAAPPPLWCVPCGEVRVPGVVRVHLPAETQGGVAAFDARTCPVCGWTALFASV